MTDISGVDIEVKINDREEAIVLLEDIIKQAVKMDIGPARMMMFYMYGLIEGKVNKKIV